MQFLEDLTGLFGVFKNSKFVFETVTRNDSNGVNARLGDLVRHAFLKGPKERRVLDRRCGWDSHVVMSPVAVAVPLRIQLAMLVIDWLGTTCTALALFL